MIDPQRCPAWPMLLLVLTVPGKAALAQDPPRASVRDDATVPARGEGSVGVWQSLRLGVGRGLALEVHPLVFLVAPHLTLQVDQGSWGAVRFMGRYGLSVPSGAFRLLQGTLFPSWERGGGRAGWHLVPLVGLRASLDAPTTVTWTFDGEVAFGVPLSPSDLQPLEAPAPLELLFAPALAGYRVRAGISADAPLGQRARARLGMDLFVHGVHPDRASQRWSHVTIRARGGVDWQLSRRWRLTAALMLWNSYQHAIDGEGRPVRSTDVWPWADAIWSW